MNENCRVRGSKRNSTVAASWYSPARHSRSAAAFNASSSAAARPWRRRLGHQLLEPALHGAVAQADRPRGAVPIALHLHLDVPDALQAPLDEDRGIAEDPARLAPRAVERRRQFRLAPRQPKAAAAGARRRLHQDRVAQALGVHPGDVEAARRLAAPRRHGDSRLLCEPLRRDLVAEPPHRERCSDRGTPRPAESHSSTKSGRSATNPQPAHTASAWHPTIACSSRSKSR